MVGRDRELAQVTGFLDDALAGRGCLVLCPGEAGIGKTHIVQAMQHYGVRRLVCVSATPVHPRYDTQGGFVFEKVMKPVISHTLGRTMYADLRRMENLVVQSDLDWTIVRPSGLFGAPSVTDYQVTDGFLSGRFTSRTDLADCMLRQLDNDRNVRKALAVATASGQPSFLKSFLTEGIGRQAT